MSTVFVSRDPATRTADIKFVYDPALVEAIKAYVSPSSRSWSKTTKTWVVDTLAVGDFLLHARRLGYDIVETGAAPPPPPRTPRATTYSWAEQLLTAVGPTRSDAVFRALVKVLHPDAATGDTALMQQLNNARSAVTR